MAGYKEVRNNMSEGLRFYMSLQEGHRGAGAAGRRLHPHPPPAAVSPLPYPWALQRDTTPVFDVLVLLGTNGRGVHNQAHMQCSVLAETS